MSWGTLRSFISSDIPGLTNRADDDIYDRISYRWTTAKLIIFAILVSTKQYVGEPISCWVPKHFESAWEDYTNSYCWIRNTYWLPWSENIPQDITKRAKNPIIYYQWVPLLLFGQALFFFMPILFWRGLNGRTGLNLKDIIYWTKRLQNGDHLDERKAILALMIGKTDRYLEWYKQSLKVYEPRESCGSRIIACFRYIKGKFVCSRRQGNYLSWLHLFTKLIFLANVLGQLFALNKFLGHDYNMYGLDVLHAVANNEDWKNSPKFPRVTLCDFDIRRLGNVHRYTVQCVLTINFFNEKMYLYLWFWLVFVTMVTMIGILFHVLRMILAFDRMKYIEIHIINTELYDSHIPNHREMMKMFVNQYLDQDGVFMLRLVGHNTNKMTVTEFITGLWTFYKEVKHKKDDDEENHIGGTPKTKRNPLKKQNSLFS